VECDEKQWRGQPLPAAAGKTPGAGPAVDFRQGGSAASRSSSGVPTKPVPLGGVRPSASSSGSTTTPLVSSPGTLSSPPASPAAAPAAAVAPQSLAAALAELNEQERRLEAARRGEPVAAPVAQPAEAVEPERQEAAVVSAPALAPVPVAVLVPATAGENSGLAVAKPVEVTEPGGNAEPAREIPQNLASFDFSGGLGTSESWLGKNKYILGAILVIAGVVAGIVWLR